MQESARDLTPAEQSAFRAGKLVVRYGGGAGTNLCATFHPAAYVRVTLSRGWNLLSYAPSELLKQDLPLLQRPR